MCSHFSFMSHEATSCSCSQQASRLGACISLGHMHGSSSHLGLPSQQPCLSYLLSHVEDISKICFVTVLFTTIIIIMTLASIPSMLTAATSKTLDPTNQSSSSCTHSSSC